jgi:hypothetical protein
MSEHRMTNKNYFLLLIGLIWLQPCWAYLDPGNGYILLQALAAGFAGLVAVLRLYSQKLKALWHRLWRRTKTENKHDNSAS